MNLLTVEPVDIIDCLQMNGHDENAVRLLDSKYVLPTSESIAEFAKRYASFLWTCNLSQGIENIWDCDKFALLAKSLANIDNAVWRSKTDNKNCGLAFGVCFVHTKEGGHAINLAILQEPDGRLGVHYYEPQFQTTDEGLNICMIEKSKDTFLQPVFCFL